MFLYFLFFFFFFNDTATTEIYTLSLHDALPISFVRDLFLSRSFLFAHRFTFGRSTRSSRNSIGPLMSRRLRWARSSGGAVGSPIFSIALAASSAAREERPAFLAGFSPV